MKNQYRNYRIALLKSEVCLLANCMEETYPQRDKPTFIFFHECISRVERQREMLGVITVLLGL